MTPRRRDNAEPSIIAALKQVGASVQTLSETGVPDLLVGFRGRTFLLEVKDEHGKQGRGMAKTKTGLRDSQEDWWRKWKGAEPAVVTTPEEALRAVGAVGGRWRDTGTD